MSATTVDYRSLEPVTVYATSGTAAGMGPENISPVIGPLLQRLDGALAQAGRPALEPGVFWYDSVDGSDEITVHVSYTAESPPRDGAGYEVVDLPAIPRAAVLEHRGEMATIGDSWMRLVDQLLADGYRMAGASREVYLVAADDVPQSEWVTQLQVPVEPAGPSA